LREAEITCDLEGTALLEEVNWRHKLSALLLREGDKSIKFFHRVANSNRGNNIVESLVVNGSVSLDTTVRREHILQFYIRLYSDF
jgi:hypothetical protein